MSHQPSDNSTQIKNTKRPGFWKTIVSSLAMLIGIQSRKNHAEDFEAGIWHLVIVGLICAVIFFVSIFGLVQIIMANID